MRDAALGDQDAQQDQHHALLHRSQKPDRARRRSRSDPLSLPSPAHHRARLTGPKRKVYYGSQLPHMIVCEPAGQPGPHPTCAARCCPNGHQRGVREGCYAGTAGLRAVLKGDDMTRERRNLERCCPDALRFLILPSSTRRPSNIKRMQVACDGNMWMLGASEEYMAAVTRLVTFVDVADHVADPRQMSVSARHEAELVEGSRVLLLNDRGWGSSLGGARTASEDDSRHEHFPDIWAATSVEDIQETARMVVGPDEPFDGRSQEDMEVGHWAYLQQILQKQGVIVDAAELRQLPHDVVLSQRLLARIGGDPDTGTSG